MGDDATSLKAEDRLGVDLLRTRIWRLEVRVRELEDAQTAAAIGEALDAMHAFQARSFWQRWRWLLTGR